MQKGDTISIGGDLERVLKEEESKSTRCRGKEKKREGEVVNFRLATAPLRGER